MTNLLQQTFQKIDEENAKDPNAEQWQGKSYPKELLYAQRMTNRLNLYAPNASEELQIAARAQHIKRWEIPREDFAMDKAGYHKWRNTLKSFHAGQVAEIMQAVGYKESSIDRVKFLVEKKKLKKDADTQMLEDVICFVFLEYYLDDFATTKSEEKIIDILQKTWQKISDRAKGQLDSLSMSDESRRLVQKALSASDGS
ncbi:MAG: DUF4202 domain-containing protein [Saprospiraceae bacterium]|nr:DUF4202 domain-containing protein [Saprospiraceae bacterium]